MQPPKTKDEFVAGYMDNEQLGENIAGRKSEDQEIGLIDIMIILAKSRRLLWALPLIMGVIATALAYSLPNVYTASTTLLPPQQSQSSASALLSQLGGAASAAAGMAGLKSPGDVYVGMLRSRRIADKLIEKYDLKETYGTDSQEQARNRLQANTTITAGKDGLITIAVEDRKQMLVAPLANAYVAELLGLTKNLAVTESSQRRMFFEQQLKLSSDNLARAESLLKTAIDTRGVISVGAESEALVATMARVRAQVSAKEIQLNSMRAFVTAGHPDFLRVKEELASLRSELSRLTRGTGPSSGAAQGGAQGGLANIQLLRDVKYYQMLYELLAKQYEVARLDEAKEPSMIQVLDMAAVPERNVKPRRAFIVLGSMLAGLALAIIIAFAREAKRRMRTTSGGRARMNELSQI